MGRSKRLLVMMYCLFFIWILGLYINFSAPNILFSILLSIYSIPFVGGSLAYSLLVFQRTGTNKGKGKVTAIVFLIPFILLVVLTIKQEFSAKPMPNDEQIHSFFAEQLKEDATVIASNVSRYDRKTKSLELFIAINSDSYIRKADEYAESGQPLYSMELLKRIFIELPGQLHEVTAKPETIHVYGYWDKQLFFEEKFVKAQNKYIRSGPLPEISWPVP